MNCVQCGQKTSIASAYALPVLVRAKGGALVNLCACSLGCRAQWFDVRQTGLDETDAGQADAAFRKLMRDQRAARIQTAFARDLARLGALAVQSATEEPTQ